MDQPVMFEPGAGGLDQAELAAARQLVEDAASTREAGRVGDGRLAADVRRSTIQWLPFSDGSQWLFSRVYSLAHVANVKSGWEFDIDGPNERLQVGHYRASELGMYDWHMDIGSNGASSRKITVVIEIESADEGGILQFRPGPSPYSMAAAPGMAVVFPSYLAHRLTPVTEGCRTSIVSWICGRPFR